MERHGVALPFSQADPTMAQTLPSSDKMDNRTGSSNLVPPDERFWQHYSPHGEFPLSSVSSLVIHLLFFGLLALTAWLGVVLFSHSSRSLPVEAVRLDLGGGGGNPHGRGDAPNTGAAPKEVGSQQSNNATENPQQEEIPPKDIKVDTNPKVKPNFEDPSKRTILLPDAQTGKTFSRLRDQAARIQQPGSKPSGYGKGGIGSSGGSGSGQGTGTGSGHGEGPGNLTQREKRQHRWHLFTKTHGDTDYANQLQGLGAVLAIPVAERGDDFDYVIVRDLSARPVKFSRLDTENGQRELSSMMRWLNDAPQQAAGVISALGIPKPKIAPEKIHFFAALPEKFERKLLDVEMAYLHKRHPNLNEEDIEDTEFDIIRSRDGKYEPVVRKQRVR
jgi:hypothetical protein